MAPFKLNTRCVHGERGPGAGNAYGAINVPIFQTATFAHPGVDRSTGFDYSRQTNPTRTALERVMSSLEGAADTLATASGMAAVTLAFGLFSRGDHIICTEDLYGGSVRYFDFAAGRDGLQFTYVDTADVGAVARAVRPETRALYIETPSNPTMRVTDLRAMKRLAVENNLLLIVDNTLMSPCLQRPIALGADLVIHSGTKYLAGHNDVIAGFLCSADAAMAERLRRDFTTTGACLAPMDAFLTLRGIKTLSLRVARQQENAEKIARWLGDQPAVREVAYVGLPEHPGYAVHRRQADGVGSMIALRLDGAARAVRVLERVSLISYAESLGGVESLITYPMKQTHGDVPQATRQRLGITGDFLRLSVGIEDADDLIADLAQALA
jgi:cystathionine gamma-synthase